MSARDDHLYCQPCGECAWCRGNRKAKAEVRQLRRDVRALAKQITRLAGDLMSEGMANDLESPTIRGHVHDAERARKVRDRVLAHLPARKVKP